MATNLVSEISQVFDSRLTSRVASAFGLDETQVRKVADAGVPGLLAALISFVSVIGGSGQKALIDTGASALTSLLGGKTVSALTSAASAKAAQRA